MKEGSREFHLYKGLKRPLMFKGLKGKYIYQAAGAFVGTMVSAIALSNLMGFFVGLALALALGGGMVWNVFRRQKKKGLYSKKRNNAEIHIMPVRIKLKQAYEKESV